MLKVLNVNLSEEKKQQLLSAMFFMSAIVLMMVLSRYSFAGTDDTFDGWVTKMTDWMEGSLGKGVAIAFVIVGIIMGITKQSLMAVAIGVGAALGINYAPGVIDSMFTAIL